MPTIYLIILIPALTILWIYRIHKVSEFREIWFERLKHTPEGIDAYKSLMPGFNRMVFTFWKPVRDKYWAPPAIRAGWHVSKLKPKDRKRLMDYVNAELDKLSPEEKEKWFENYRKKEGLK